jgi:hypothetical protein
VAPRLLALVACAGAACSGTPTSGWSVPTAVENGALPADELALGGDPAGDVIAAWARAGDGVAAARFDHAGRTWSPPVALAPEANADQVSLSVGAAGSAIVVWRDRSGELASIWSSWFDRASGTWRAPELVERDETGDAAAPSVAAMPGGGAVAVWHQWDGLRESLWANTLAESPARWTGRFLLETTDSADAIEPDVAVDAQGNAVAVWTQNDGSSVTVWAARRSADDGRWNAPFMLSESGFATANATSAPRVALDAAGNALALWTMTSSRSSSAWASRYDAGADTWSVAQPLGDTSGRASTSSAALAMDAAGNGFAAWRRSDEAGVWLWASVFSAANGSWLGAKRLEEGVGPPALAAAGDRQAAIIWQAFGDGGVRAVRFDGRSGGWGPSTVLDRSTGGFAPPQISVDPAGGATAIFTRSRQGARTGVWAVHAAP